MSTRSIRSAAHRQILAWLRYGPSTVSDIARQFGMRMPHASLACRQLRAQNLIVRDESGGLRNAPIYLSQEGIDRLRENSVSKLRKHSSNIGHRNEACILQADHSNVLIGYVETPSSPLLFIPSSRYGTPEASTGNQGGVWVLTSEESIEWFSLRDFERTTPPTSSQGTTLQDFGQAPEKIGIVRATVFETVGDEGLVEGAVFPIDAFQHASPPLRLNHGEVSLGTVFGTDFLYCPPHGLAAFLPSSLDRALVLAALGRGAVEISDRWGSRKRVLPVDVLRTWLSLKHNRMSIERLETMLSDLLEQIQAPDQHVPPSLRRELSVDFGDVEWTSAPWAEGQLDIYGMAQRGVEAVLSCLVDEGIPYCVDWPFESSPAIRERMVAHPSCRIWVTRKNADQTAWIGENTLFPSSTLASVGLALGKGTTLPLQLGPVDHHLRIEHAPTSVPADAGELLQAGGASTSPVYSQTAPIGEEGRRLTSALRLFPTGDESLANQWELEDALAAWIASTPEQRPHRWVRLHNRLPNGWVDLMKVEHAPLSHLPHALANASRAWKRNALHRIRTEIHRSPTLLLELVAGLDERTYACWYATCLLNSLEPNASEHVPLLEQALDIWMQDPEEEVQVIEHLFGRLSLQNGTSDPLLEKWLRRAREQPKNSVLSSWAEAVELTRTGGPWLPEKQRLFMESLPEAWWSPFAGEWLASQLTSASGRSWLKEHRVSWLSQLFVHQGMLSGLPGALVPFPEFSLSADQLITINLLGDGPGVPMLSDVYETVYAHEQDLPVPPLKCHPLGGWLIRPITAWPVFDASVLDMGDHLVGRLLFARSFAQRM